MKKMERKEVGSKPWAETVVGLWWNHSTVLCWLALAVNMDTGVLLGNVWSHLSLVFYALVYVDSG